MLTQVYFFRKSTGGAYSQYPTDFTHSIFSDMLKKATNKVQVVVHRDGDLLYYGYMRQMSDGGIIGICIAADRIFNDSRILFSHCDEVVEHLTSKGIVLYLSEGGKVNISPTELSEEHETLEIEANALIAQLEKKRVSTTELPPQDFTVSIHDDVRLSLEGGNSAIADSLKRYTNLYIAIHEYEIERIKSYGAQIRTYEKTISNLESQVKELKEKTGIGKSAFISTIVLAVIAILIVCFVVKPSHTEEPTIDTTISVSNIVTHQAVLNPDGTGYYWTGELINGQPNGEGTIDYAEKDHDKREQYIGVIKNGQRQADNATLTYRNGNKYVGSFNKDDFGNGTLTLKNDGMYFKGDFRNNKPYNGYWYFNDGTRYSSLVKGAEKVL